ncbi:MAG: riboflavin kinase, partial [Gemmatimonadota bacterium]
RAGAIGGMMNLGGRPTVGEVERPIEVHGFDLTGDFYGQWVRIDLVARLRETLRFDGPEALVAQLRRDEAAARRLLG